MKIPKKIFQIAFSGGKDIALPEEINTAIRYMREKNPHWEYCLYDDDTALEFLKLHAPNLVDTFLSISAEYMAARADFFRYVVAYYQGGCYLDLKSKFTRPLDDIIQEDDEMILTHWDNQRGETYEGWGHFNACPYERGEFMQCFILCRQQHPYLGAVVDKVTKNIAEYRPDKTMVGWNGVINTTGPVPFTQAIASLEHLGRHRVSTVGDLGFVFSVYDEAYGRKDKRNHNKVFGKHYNRLKLPIVPSQSHSQSKKLWWRLLLDKLR